MCGMSKQDSTLNTSDSLDSFIQLLVLVAVLVLSVIVVRYHQDCSDYS